MAGRDEQEHGRGGGNNRFGYGAAAWGAVGVLATILAILQGPKAIVDLHELMCGSSSFQGVAERFADCAAGAAKPAPTAVPGAPPSQAKAERYEVNYRRFWQSAQDGDRAELDSIYAEGWRIKPEEACYLLRFGPPGPGKKRITAIVDDVLRFSSGKIACDGKDVATSLFDLLIAEKRCFRDVDTSSTSDIAVIDRVASAQPSQSFQDAAARLLKALDTAAAATRDQLVEVCTTRYGSGRQTMPADQLNDLTSVLRFATSCQMLLTPSALNYLGFDHQANETGEATASACQSSVKQAGVDPKAAALRSYLDRWVK